MFLCGLVAIECALAWFAPLPPHGGVYTDRNGKPARVSLDDDTLARDLDILHSASEFSASIHTNALGYRLMSKESATPDFLFVGDSFTFGHGVSDSEVFAEVFCKTRAATCVNLARSGTDTFDQVRILRRGIDAHRLRPKTVVLTMLAACWLDVAGNDLGDLHEHAGQRSALAAPMRADLMPSPGDIVKAIQRRVVDFEITKRVMIVATSGLKSSLYACSSQSERGRAARHRRGIASACRARRGIPLQGRRRRHPSLSGSLDGAFRSTEALVAGAVPETFACIATGSRFRKDHYYAYDGHFNASGHANLAADPRRAGRRDLRACGHAMSKLNGR